MAINVDRIKAYQVQKNNVQQQNNNYMSFKGNVEDSFEKEKAPEMADGAEDEDVVDTAADEENNKEESHTGRNWAIAGGVVALASAITLGILHHRGSDILEKAGKKDAGFWEKISAGFHGKAPETNKTPETKNTSEAPKADESNAPETPQPTEVVKPDPKTEKELQALKNALSNEYSEKLSNTTFEVIGKQIEVNAAKEEIAALEKQTAGLEDAVKNAAEADKAAKQDALDKHLELIKNKQAELAEKEKVLAEANGRLQGMMTEDGYKEMQALFDTKTEEYNKLKEKIESMTKARAETELKTAQETANKAQSDYDAAIAKIAEKDEQGKTTIKTAVESGVKNNTKYENLDKAVKDKVTIEEYNNVIEKFKAHSKAQSDVAQKQHMVTLYEEIEKEGFADRVQEYTDEVNNALSSEITAKDTAAQKVTEKKKALDTARNDAINNLSVNDQKIIEVSNRKCMISQGNGVTFTEEVSAQIAEAEGKFNEAVETATVAAETAEKTAQEEFNKFGISDKNVQRDAMGKILSASDYTTFAKDNAELAKTIKKEDIFNTLRTVSADVASKNNELKNKQDEVKYLNKTITDLKETGLKDAASKDKLMQNPQLPTLRDGVNKKINRNDKVIQAHKNWKDAKIEEENADKAYIDARDNYIEGLKKSSQDKYTIYEANMLKTEKDRLEIELKDKEKDFAAFKALMEQMGKDFGKTEAKA